jgi:ketosteroid isomerase-like protein
VHSHRALVEASTEAWNGLNLAGWLETFDPDIEFRSSGAFPGLRPVYRGYDGLTAFWRAFHEPWETLRFDLQRFAEGDDWTVGEFRFRAKGVSSGAQVDMIFCNVSRIRNGRFVEISARNNFDEALSALEQEGRRV